MNKPKYGEMHGWNAFVKWGQSVGVNFEYKEDWQPWWDCWKRGYIAGVNGET